MIVYFNERRGRVSGSWLFLVPGVLFMLLGLLIMIVPQLLAIMAAIGFIALGAGLCAAAWESRHLDRHHRRRSLWP